MLGQPPDFRSQFLTKVQEAAARHELPEDALAYRPGGNIDMAEIDRCRHHTHTPVLPPSTAL
jgi:hypothetical protein